MINKIYKNILHKNSRIQYSYIFSKNGNLFGISIHSQNLTTFPVELLVHRKSITYLDLSFNKFQDISFIEQFSNLEELNLSVNLISELTPIEKLYKLKILYLCNNRITSIAKLTDLKNLYTLNLTSNKISDITPLNGVIERTNIFLSNGGLFDGVYLHDNPIQTPPKEIIHRGRDSVLRYIEQYQTSNIYVNNELKLILIGNSSVGKTSLAKYLDSKIISKSHSSTHGINDITIKRTEWHEKINEIKIRILDFGGQEYYHDTHRLFFTSDTLYVYIWTKASNSFSCHISPLRINGETIKVPLYNYPIKYWLDTVKYFGSDETEINKDIKLLSIQSKIDLEGIEMLNNKELKEEYPFIYDFTYCCFHKVSDLERIEELLKIMVSDTQIIGSTYIKSWWIVRQIIEKSEKYVYSFSEFSKLIEDNGGSVEIEQIGLLANFLSDIGIVVIYAENNKIISLYKSEWLIKTIYQVLDAKVKENEGEFSKNHVQAIVKIDAEKVISIMLRFKLIIKLPNSETFATPLYFKNSPDGLTKDIIKKFKTDNSTVCKFQVDGFIHKSIILDFLSEFSQYIHNNNLCYSVWRNGVLLVSNQIDNNYILIEFNDKTNNQFSTINISVLDEKKGDNLIIQIINKIDSLLWKSTKLISNISGDFLEHSIVEANSKYKNNEFIYQNKKYYVNSFFGFRKANSDKDKNNTKNIYLSYAFEDIVYLKKVKKHLKVLEKEGFNIYHFDKTDIEPGMNRNEVIVKNIANTQIAVLLISNDYLISDHITEIELPSLIGAVKNRKAVILPLVIRPCRFEKNFELSQFQTIHNPKQPISSLSSNDQEEVLLKLTERIEELIKENE